MRMIKKIQRLKKFLRAEIKRVVLLGMCIFVLIGCLFFCTEKKSSFENTEVFVDLPAGAIPVFLAADENYAPFASLLMKSVLNNTSSFVCFVVMDGGIKAKTKKLIEKDLEKYPNKKLYFADMEKYDLENFPSIRHYTTNTFSRYFIHDIAPELKKVIYLDSDIIVRKDIKELYEQDMGGYPIAALPEIKYFFPNGVRRLKMSYPKFQGQEYFNAGVLLIDVQKFNQMGFYKKAIDLTQKLNGKTRCPDQDVFNILFENNFKQLSADFNFMPIRMDFYRRANPDSKIDPVVLHYATSLKPWNTNYSYFQKDFEDVLRDSVFYEVVKKKYRKKRSKF